VTDAFEWDDANPDHIDEHGVDPDEAGDAVLDPGRVPIRADSSPGEKRRAVIGATEDGRIVVVYTRWRDIIRIVTAYDASERKKRQDRRGRT
jgi:uncharacterized protein